MSDTNVVSTVSTVSTNVPKYTGVQARALELLGDGLQSSIVAQTLGVSESYISQLLADEQFLKGVVEKRYEHLVKHNKRDAEYDGIEDQLLERLKATLPMLFDPLKITRVLQVINAAKRRGQSTPDSITQQNVIVNLTLPTAIIDRFSVTKDANNQIIEAGEQKLVTIQSGTLLDRLKQQSQAQTVQAKQIEGPNGEQQNGIIAARSAPPNVG